MARPHKGGPPTPTDQHRYAQALTRHVDSDGPEPSLLDRVEAFLDRFDPRRQKTPPKEPDKP